MVAMVQLSQVLEVVELAEHSVLLGRICGVQGWGVGQEGEDVSNCVWKEGQGKGMVACVSSPPTQGLQRGGQQSAGMGKALYVGAGAIRRQVTWPGTV